MGFERASRTAGYFESGLHSHGGALTQPSIYHLFFSFFFKHITRMKERRGCWIEKQQRGRTVLLCNCFPEEPQTCYFVIVI